MATFKLWYKSTLWGHPCIVATSNSFNVCFVMVQIHLWPPNCFNVCFTLLWSDTLTCPKPRWPNDYTFALWYLSRETTFRGNAGDIPGSRLSISSSMVCACQRMRSIMITPYLSPLQIFTDPTSSNPFYGDFSVGELLEAFSAEVRTNCMLTETLSTWYSAAQMHKNP